MAVNWKRWVRAKERSLARSLAATQTIDNFTCIWRYAPSARCPVPTYMRIVFILFFPLFFWWLQFARFILFHFKCAHAAHFIYEQHSAPSQSASTWAWWQTFSERKNEWKDMHSIVWCLAVRWSNKCFQNHLFHIERRSRAPFEYLPTCANWYASRVNIAQQKRNNNECCFLLNEEIFMDENESCAILRHWCILAGQ